MSISQRIKEISKNEKARTLASNFLYLCILKGLSLLFPLITLPYLARVIGPSKFGAIAFASSIMVIVETITDWGFNYTATRDVAQNREDIKVVSSIYSQVICSRLILTVISFVALFICTHYIPSLKEYKELLWLTFLYIPGNILLPQWFFQAFEKMRFITIFSLIATSIFTALIFIVIRKESDYIYQPLLNACSYIAIGIVAQYVIFKQFGVRLIIPKWTEIFQRTKKSTDMFISLLLPNLYTNFSVILLTSTCGNLATGIYNGGQRFQNLIDQITQILSRTFFPFLARNNNKHHIYVKISACIAVLASLAMFFGSGLFVDIFLTKEFEDAKYVMRIFSITPIFLFLMNTYGTNYLVIVGEEHILRNIIAGVSVLGFFLTWYFTPLYSYYGVAITITVVWGIRGLLTWHYASRVKKNKS